MAHKEATLVIDEKLVQFRCDRAGHTESVGDTFQNDGYAPRPTLTMDLDLIRVDLPGPPHVGIDQGSLAAAKRRAVGDGDQLLGLGRQQRQGDGADTFDLKTRGENFAGADGAKVAGTLDPINSRARSVAKDGTRWSLAARPRGRSGVPSPNPASEIDRESQSGGTVAIR